MPPERIVTPNDDLLAALQTPGTVYLTGGRHDVDNSEPVELPSFIRVTGARNASINRQDPTHPLATCADPSKHFYVEFDGLRFFDRNPPAALSDAAPLLKGELVEQLSIRRCQFKDIHGGIVHGKSFNRCKLTDCSFVDCQGRLTDLQSAADFHVTDVEVTFPHSTHEGDGAFRFVGSDSGTDVTDGGVHLERTVIMGSERPLRLRNVFNVGVDRVVFDGHRKPPLLTDVGTTKWNGCTFAGYRGAPGLVIDGGANHKLGNCRFAFADGAGFRAINTALVLVGQSTARNCSTGFDFRGCRRFGLYGCAAENNDGPGVAVRDTARSSQFGQVVGGHYYNNGVGIAATDTTTTMSILGAMTGANDTEGIRVGPTTTGVLPLGVIAPDGIALQGDTGPALIDHINLT